MTASVLGKRDYPGLSESARARFAARWRDGASRAALMSDFGLSANQVGYYRQILGLKPRRIRGRPRQAAP